MLSMSKTLLNWTHADLMEAVGKMSLTDGSRKKIEAAFASCNTIDGKYVASFKVQIPTPLQFI